MAAGRKLKTVPVPPDGGWGWVVCFAYGLSNIISVPIIQSFGLLFKEKCVNLGMSATDTTIIINANSAFGMTMGLVNGSLLKKYGYRKLSVVGSVLISGGMILTAFANSFTYFLITYGIITSLGFGLSMASYSLALNSYFRKKRGLATGFAMTFTGLGPIIMPLIMSYLLDEYSNEGTVLLIAGLSLHSFIAASLLQPLKWHMKKEAVDQEMIELGKKNKKEDLTESLLNEAETKADKSSKTELTDSKLAINHDVDTQSIYGFDTPLPRRKISQTSSVFETGTYRKRALSRSVSQQEKTIWQSTQSINSAISLKSTNEVGAVGDAKNGIKSTTEETAMGTPDTNVKEERRSSCLEKLVLLLDLDLLKDPIYLNLMIGMSLAVWAEINFSLLTPFILNDFHLNTHEIAHVMSTIAATDIVFRFCAPFVANWLKATAKMMYMGSLILLVLSRTALIFVATFQGIIGVAVFLGLAKGFRTVFMSLLIPNYVPIEKLASASGIQMVANGVLILCAGPFLGVIRDFTGSYNVCIILINCVTCFTILMWTIEFIYVKYIRKINT